MRLVKKLLSIVVLIIALTCITELTIASEPPPPPGGTGLNGNQGPGGTAPLGSGLVILLSLGAGYGARKLIEKRKK
jgi:hypothetical protein